jgi:hypothetical protein
MPYIPLRNGDSLFIEDEQEAEKRYKEEWGSPAPQSRQAPTPAAPAERKEDKKDDGNAYLDFLAGAANTAARTLSPIYNIGAALQQAPAITLPGEKVEGEPRSALEELTAAGQEGVRKLINDPIAMLGALQAMTQQPGQKAFGGGYATGGTGSLMPVDPEVDEKFKRRREAAEEAYRRTGKDVEGFSYGIRPDVPIIGPMLSSDSDYVKESQPKTAVGKVSASIFAAIGFDKGVSSVVKTPVAAGATGMGIRQIIKDGNIREGLKQSAKFVVKDLVPDTLQDAMFFAPEYNGPLNEELSKIRELETVEERQLAMQALLADTEEDFNYYTEQLNNIAGGATFMVGLRLTLKVARASLQYVKAGKSAEEAFQKAAEEITPETRAALETAIFDRAEVVLEESVGNATARLHNKIDDTVGEVSTSMRAGAENYLRQQSDFAPKLRRLDQELGEIPDVAADVQNVTEQVDVLKKRLSVSTTDEIAAKRGMMEARLAAYDAEIKLDPDWINKSTGKGKRRGKNSTRYNNALRAARELQELQALELKRLQLQNVELRRADKAAEIEQASLGFMTNTVGFRNALDSARILVNSIEEINAQRIGFLEARNSSLFQQNRLNEMNRDYSLPGPFGEAYGDLKNLLDAAEAAVVSNNLNPDFVRDFIKRVDDIHNKVIENGGTAPTFPELPPNFEELAARTEAPAEAPTAEAPTAVAAPAEEAETLAEQAKRVWDQAEGVIPERLATRATWEELGEENQKQLIDTYLEAGLISQKAQLEPKVPAPVQNVVPLTKTDDGQIVIDTNTIAARRVEAQTAQGTAVTQSAEDYIQQAKKELEISQDPTDTFNSLDEFVNQSNAKFEAWDAAYKNTGSEEAANKTLQIYNTNARKYTSSLENASAMKAVFDGIDRQTILPAQYASAVRRLSSFLTEGNTELRMAASFIESAEFGKDIQNNLNKIMVPVATLDSSATQTLAAARDLRKILGGEEVEGLDRITALEEFAVQYQLFTLNAKALNELFNGVGNALRLFSKRGALKFDIRDPNVLFSELNQQLLKLGTQDDVADNLSKKAKEAKAEFEARMGEFFEKVKKGEDLTDEELSGFENLVEKVYETGGDLNKLDGLTVTGDAVLANLQIGSPLSNPATIASIPIEGITNAANELISQAISGHITGRMAKWLGQTEFAKETLDEARLAQDTLLQLRFVFGEALEATYNRFVYGKAITDPAQAAQNAYELRRSGGLRREEAISQDLAAKQVKIPFMNYVMERSKDNEELFDTINKSRVLTKVFHDYFMPGEAWDKRGFLGKYILGGTTTALRKAGVGKKSYYPSGENVNLTLMGQLSATADELNTALFANARIRALVNQEVDELISQNIIDPADRGAEIQKRLVKETSNMYQPVKVGFDQKTVGYSVLDNQILELTRAVNLTEELTGPLKNVENMINELRRSKIPAVAFFGRDIFPFTTSPINAIKRAIKIAYGGEIAQAAVDTARLGAKTLPEQVLNRLPADWNKNIINFESKYFSSDPKVRIRAQGALALSVGINTMAWFLVRDGNQDIVGGLENTYRETTGARDPYTIKVGGMMLPYRYLPHLGNSLALHANIRDIQQFAPGKDTFDVLALSVASLASTIMEVPALAGFEQIIKALQAGQRGDATRIQKMIANSIAKIGDPYLNLRKTVIQGIDPRKPASPVTKYSSTEFYETGKKVGQLTNKDFVTGVLDTSLGTFGIATEYMGVGALADAFAEVIRNEPGFRENSRKALWYGKPGETVNANHAGKWYPAQAVLGRYWLFPDRLEDDVVAKEMVYNLIPPPRTTLYQNDGVVINPTVLNNFNHFLNSEFEYFDVPTGKAYKGVNGYLKDLINSELYQSYPSVDSPFKQTSMFGVQVGEGADWDRNNNQRRVILKGEVDRLISIAKEQFLFGTLKNQRYKAPEDLKKLIQQKRMAGE